MKKNCFYLLAMMMAMAVCVSFASCGNDDDSWDGDGVDSWDGQISSAYFPDENFRNYLLAQSYGKDGVITEEEVKTITGIYVNNQNISNLKGIEHFTALTNLQCSQNQLTSLDVSKNTKLIELWCFSNQLTSLDVSKNTALTGLHCDVNKLTRLDVSKNIALKTLDCSSCQLTNLDVSKNTALTWLICDDNQLTNLDVSKNTALTRIECYRNQIKGKAMDSFINSLPQNKTNQARYFDVYDNKASNEGNICTKIQVAAVKEKGWMPRYTRDNKTTWEEYKGSDE